MAILIDNRQAKYPLETSTVQKKAQAILNALGSPDDILSIAVVEDEQITRFNEQYLHHQGPTNVIAFSMREGDHGDVNPELIGDVVISIDTCDREAHEAAIDTELRFDQLLVHGILHLFGYDHTGSDEQAQAMEARAAELIDLIRP